MPKLTPVQLLVTPWVQRGLAPNAHYHTHTSLFSENSMALANILEDHSWQLRLHVFNGADFSHIQTWGML